jgi:O-succinylbenzoic acid--CoA ligase
MKDFNNLIINGQVFSKENLLKLTVNTSDYLEWEQDFYAFIKQWLNDENYIAVQTSGSTGKPKMLKVLKSRMIASAQMTCKFLHLKPKDKALLCLSTKHIGGMMMVVRAFCARLNLIAQVPSGNPLQFINETLDFIAIVPYQAKIIIAENPENLRVIPHIIIGGGKVDYSLSVSLQKEQIIAYSTFGMTETLSHIALQKIGKEDSYSCLEGIEVKSDSAGKLIIHAPALLENILHTNDLVSIISSKEFKWLGRADFAIESGGLKFIPEQIEQKLAPKITARFIISSRPHTKLNNEIILLIEGEKSQIDSQVFESLDLYEQPKHIYFINQFIETANGKIDRIKTRNLI